MILGIESSSTDLSVAVATEDGTLLGADDWTSDRRGGHELLPRLLDLLSATGVSLDDATALAVGGGPGSFTGLRVGMSIAKGLALALERPIVAIPSLAAWLAAEPVAPAAVGRAGARDAYLLLRDDPEVRITPADELPPDVRRAAVVAPSELRTAFDLPAARPPRSAAAAICRLAAARLAELPAGDDLARVEPAYLRLPRGVARSSAEVIRWP
jgi:tRNA threonylcarbamoyl adenosine modification protein YeaZ